MNHNDQIKESVRAFRLQGLSLSEISGKTKIPLTTIHSWVSTITLSDEQRLTIKNRSLVLLQQGRVRAQAENKKLSTEKAKKLLEEGKAEINKLNKNELFIAGIALYWAEGFKNLHERRLGFCNSDPSMIRFYAYWLESCLGVKKSSLVARLTLNKSYKGKTEEIEKYWSNIIGVPLNQFTKPFYQNSKWKKQYDNTDNYYGVLRVHVKESLEHLLKMRGWIEGLRQHLPTVNA